jgi:spermidine/putrescine transport system ATP-binding protein
MDAGLVQQCGTPEEIYERPTKTFVAGFIGISNLLPGKVEGDSVRLTNGTLCEARLSADYEDGDDVYLSVRPEKLWLDELEEGMVTVEGTVAERIYLGTTTQVIIELAPDVRIVSLEQNTDRARAEDRWRIGDKITVGWHAEFALPLH